MWIILWVFQEPLKQSWPQKYEPWMPIFKHVGHCSVAFFAHSGVLHEYSDADILNSCQTNRLDQLKFILCFIFSFFFLLLLHKLCPLTNYVLIKYKRKFTTTSIQAGDISYGRTFINNYQNKRFRKDWKQKRIIFFSCILPFVTKRWGYDAFEMWLNVTALNSYGFVNK